MELSVPSGSAQDVVSRGTRPRRAPRPGQTLPCRCPGRLPRPSRGGQVMVTAGRTLAQVSEASLLAEIFPVLPRPRGRARGAGRRRGGAGLQRLGGGRRPTPWSGGATGSTSGRPRPTSRQGLHAERRRRRRHGRGPHLAGRDPRGRPRRRWTGRSSSPGRWAGSPTSRGWPSRGGPVVGAGRHRDGLDHRPGRPAGIRNARAAQRRPSGSTPSPSTARSVAPPPGCCVLLQQDAVSRPGRQPRRERAGSGRSCEPDAPPPGPVPP